MKRKGRFIFLFSVYTTFMFTPSLVYCQKISEKIASRSFSSIIAGDLNHIIYTTTALLKAPFNFNGSDWSRLAFTGAVTIALFTIDLSIKNVALSNQNSLNDHIFAMDRYIGSLPTLYAAVAIYGSGFILRQDKIRTTGLYALEAFVLAQSITGALKMIYGRRRPYGGKDHLYFLPFKGAELYRSLPSGHTSGAFAFATVMADVFETPLLKIFWYGSAVLVAGARIYHNKHWISDTFLSAIIGYSVAKFVIHNDENRLSSQRFSVTLSPILHYQMKGIALSIFM